MSKSPIYCILAVCRTCVTTNSVNMTYARHESPSSSVVRASDQCTEVHGFHSRRGPRSRHVEYSIFSYFFSELKIHHLSLFINRIVVLGEEEEVNKIVEKEEEEEGGNKIVKDEEVCKQWNSKAYICKCETFHFSSVCVKLPFSWHDLVLSYV